MTQERTQRRIRIGIDTGGTFTDVVAFDEDSGELVTTKTPSTPGNPADGFIAGIEKILDIVGAEGADITAVSHGTTVATNKLLEGKVEALGFITTEGYEFMLEIARQSVPDGYGNSYFWVKPDRIVPADRVRTVGGRLDFTGAEIRPFDEDGAVATARWFRDQGITTIGVCLIHAYANDDHELRMRDILRREHPDAIVSISSEVLREYREYERAMTTLVDAAVKPNVSRYVTNISERLIGFTGNVIPFYVMKSNGGVLSADEVVHQPITTVLSGPAAGALGAALIAKVAGFPRILTCDGGGTSTDVSVVLDGEPTLTTEGTRRRLPQQDPDDRRRHGRRRRWLDRLALARGLAQGRPALGGRRPRSALLRQGRHAADDHRRPRHPRPDPSAPARRRDPARRGGSARRHRRPRRPARPRLRAVRHRHPRDLRVEPGQRAAPGLGQARPRRPRLHADDLRRVGVAPGLPARRHPRPGGRRRTAQPGQRVAFGLLTVDVKNDYVQTHVAKESVLDHAGVQGILDDLTDRARGALAKEGFTADQHQFQRTIDVRYVGQAYEVRVAAPEGTVDAAYVAQVAETFHAEHRQLYGYDFRGDPTQQVEWVNLRVTGIGPITRPEIPTLEKAAGRRGRAPCAAGATSASTPTHGYVDTPVIWRTDLGAGDTFTGPAIVEEFGSTIPVHPGFEVVVDDWANLVIRKVVA